MNVCVAEPCVVTDRDLIGSDPETIVDQELVFDALWHMRRTGIRQLPVIGQAAREQTRQEK
jgi:hypothetical protein